MFRHLFRPVGYVLLLGIVVWLSACGAPSDRASASGDRSVLGATIAAPEPATGDIGQSTGADETSATGAAAVTLTVAPVPTVPVIMTALPTATPDPVPNAAPAVAGAPIVMGIRADAFQGPEVIRAGRQTWALVNVAGFAVTIVVVDGARDQATLAMDDDAVFTSEPIAPGTSANVDVDLAIGAWMRVAFNAAGDAVIVQSFTVVG